MWAATAVVAAGTIYSAYNQRKAQDEARRDQKKAEKEARRAEVFAATEGKGKGQLGQISLEVDDEIDEDQPTSSTLSI